MKKSISKITLTAGVSLALAFTLSACPDKPDDETCDGNECNTSLSSEGSSSSVVKNSSSSNNSDGGGSVDPCPNASTTPVNAQGIGSVTCGGQTYKTVKIGEQVWMAKNLNYNAKGSKCYENSETNCNTYGRLYDWATAMANSASSIANPSGVQGVCPSGWHLPSDAEWTELMRAISADSMINEGYKLKTTSGWNDVPLGESGSGNGTDEYGFSALPSGYGYSDDLFGRIGYYGYWWSAWEQDTSIAWYWHLGYLSGAAFRAREDKSNLYSVRCVQD